VAISQTRHEYEKVHYDQKTKKEYKETLIDFVESIHQWIPYENCILEVFLNQLNEDEECFPKLIDIFPYERSSDLGLYNWSEDAAILFAEQVDNPHFIVNNTLNL